MGCCGEPYDQTQNEKQFIPNNAYPVVQQPLAHPGAQFQDKQFQPPPIPSPLPVQQFPGQNGANIVNGFPQQQQQQLWQQPQSPPPNAGNPYNTYTVPASPSPVPVMSQYTGQTVNGANLGSTLQRPTPSYFGTPNSTIMTTSKINSLRSPEPMPAADEGKMSVSIDFGKRFICLRFIFIYFK